MAVLAAWSMTTLQLSERRLVSSQRTRAPGAVRAAWPGLRGAPRLDGPTSIGAIDLLISVTDTLFMHPDN